MPTYDYRCPKGHTFELFQRMTDPPPESCAVCGANPIERVFYPVAVHFKGSGFYATDYGRGAKKREGKDGEGAARDGKKAETKADASAKGGSTTADKTSSAAD